MDITLSTGKVIKVTAKLGDKIAPWQPSGNHYKVVVNVDGNRFRFNFWDSVYNQRENKPIDLRGAIASWTMDVSSGQECDSPDMVADTFGYTKPSEAMRVYKGLQIAVKQFENSGLMLEELEELRNY